MDVAQSFSEIGTLEITFLHNYEKSLIFAIYIVIVMYII